MQFLGFTPDETDTNIVPLGQHMVGSSCIFRDKLLQDLDSPYLSWSCHGSVIFDSFLACKPLTDAKTVGVFLVTSHILAIHTSQIILHVAFGVEIAVEAIEGQAFGILEDTYCNVLPCPTEQFSDECFSSDSPQVRSILEAMVPDFPILFQIFLSGQSPI